MKVIGITGGIGAGKSQILSYIEDGCNCRILLADSVAHTVREPGQPCCDRLTALLGKEILAADGRIDNEKMAAVIFALSAGVDLTVNAGGGRRTALPVPLPAGKLFCLLGDH